jgi:hypothetical protein
MSLNVLRRGWGALATFLLAGAAILANGAAEAQEDRPGGCPEGPPCKHHPVAADPIIGTWKLNVAKSKFSGREFLKAETRVYTQSNGLFTVDQRATTRDGKEQSSRVQYRDGEDVKQASAGPADTTHAKRLNPNTWEFDLKKEGQIIGRLHGVVSSDGKTLTLRGTGTQLSGNFHDEALVFDKQ